jgi:hypothetical protein
MAYKWLIIPGLNHTPNELPSFGNNINWLQLKSIEGSVLSLLLVLLLVARIRFILVLDIPKADVMRLAACFAPTEALLRVAMRQVNLGKRVSR